MRGNMSFRLALGLLAFMLCAGATCDIPTAPYRNDLQHYTYTLAVAPVVSGTIRIEYLTDLSCQPYAFYTWPITANFPVWAIQGIPVYVRITVTADSSVQPQVPPNSTTVFLNPPNAAITILPAAPTGFKVT